MVYFRLLERIIDDERICQAVVLLKKQKGFQYDVDPIERMMDGSFKTSTNTKMLLQGDSVLASRQVDYLEYSKAKLQTGM